MDDIVKAKDITDCDNCPLYNNDCLGGWTSGGGGIPIEPPCCSWNDEDEIYEGMYDCEMDYSEQELKWIEEERKRKEEESEEKKKKEYIERLQRIVYSKSKYGSTKTSYNGSICYSWFCPNCNRWVCPGWESWHDGIGEISCTRCGDTLVYCSELDK